MRSAGFLIIALATGLGAGPALAQSKNERLDMLESRMSAVERQIEVLTDEVRKLHGDLDQMQRDLERARTQQKDQYVDLDTRLRAAEAALAAAQTSVPAGGPEAAT